MAQWPRWESRRAYISTRLAGGAVTTAQWDGRGSALIGEGDSPATRHHSPTVRPDRGFEAVTRPSAADTASGGTSEHAPGKVGEKCCV